MPDCFTAEERGRRTLYALFMQVRVRGLDGRNWYTEDRKRRDTLVWNEKSGELGFDRA